MVDCLLNSLNYPYPADAGMGMETGNQIFPEIDPAEQLGDKPWQWKMVIFGTREHQKFAPCYY